MKRYEFEQQHGELGQMRLESDGEWIRYDDHVDAMKRIAGAPVAQGLTASQVAMLHALLVSIRPEYGTPGSRDVDVGRQQKRIDAALAILAQAAPSASAQPAEPVCRECKGTGTSDGRDGALIPCLACSRSRTTSADPVAWVEEDRGTKVVVWRESPKKFDVGTKFYTATSSQPPAMPDVYEALRDMLDGWKYIRSVYGDMYGVGWDRAQNKAEAALAKATGEQS